MSKVLIERELLRDCSAELSDWRMSFPNADIGMTDRLVGEIDAILAQPAEQPTFSVGTDLSGGKLSVVVMKSEDGIARVVHAEVIQLAEQQPSLPMDEPGYERLAHVLHRAYAQSAQGKGAERHADGQPFHEQPMQQIAKRRGIGFILGQADKKSEEAQGMLRRGEADAAVRELLGAIVYIAGAIIFIEGRYSPEQTV